MKSGYLTTTWNTKDFWAITSKNKKGQNEIMKTLKDGKKQLQTKQ